MEVEIPALNEKRKIKNVQSWKQNVTCAKCGERAALLFHNISSTEKIDRTVIFEPEALVRMRYVWANAQKVSFFKAALINRIKLHVSIGFSTVTAECQFLLESDSVDENQEFELKSDENDAFTSVLLSFDYPIYGKLDSFYIASKLDSQDSGCRFAFSGRILRILNNDSEVRRFRRKQKIGVVERLESETSLICRNMFKKESDINPFVGMAVRLSSGQYARIESAFGKSGKVRITVPNGIQQSSSEEVLVHLFLKKYLDDHSIRSYLPA